MQRYAICSHRRIPKVFSYASVLQAITILPTKIPFDDGQ